MSEETDYQDNVVEIVKRRGRKPGSPKMAGRVAGTPNKATTERRKTLEEVCKIAALEMGDKISSMSALEIMTFAMQTVAKAGLLLKAADLAEKVAPYTSAKLSNVTNTNVNYDAMKSEKELEDELKQIRINAMLADREGTGKTPLSS